MPRNMDDARDFLWQHINKLVICRHLLKALDDDIAFRRAMERAEATPFEARRSVRVEAARAEEQERERAIIADIDAAMDLIIAKAREGGQT